MADIFDTLAPERVATGDSASSQRDIFDEVALPPKKDVNAGFNPLRELSRGGAGIRSMIEGKGFVQGATNPESVPSLTSAIPVQPGASEPQLWGNAIAGSIGDLATDPVSYLPLPIGKAVGSGVSALAKAGNPLFQGIARWTAEHLPNLAPNVARTASTLPGRPGVVNYSDPSGKAGMDASGTSIQDILNKIQPKQDITPVSPAAPIDQTDAYQAWLQKNAQPSTGTNPFFDVPLHPPEDARASIQELQAQQPVNIPGEQQLGLRGFQSTPKNLLSPKDLPYESPLGPVRDQGQQTFDFTKGPSVPVFKNTEEAAAFGRANKDNPEVVQQLKDTYDQESAKLNHIRSLGENASDEDMSYAFSAGQKNQLYREAYESATGTGGFKEPLSKFRSADAVEPSLAQPAIAPQDNMIQMSAQMQKEVDQIARTPNGARSAAYKGLSKDQIQELFVQRVKDKPVIKTELPAIFDTANPKMKPLQSDNIVHMADTYEMTASEADKLRRDQLIADRETVDSSPEGGVYGSMDEGAISENGLPVPKGAPSSLEDLKTVIKNIRVKGVDPNIIEMHAGAKPPDFELTPEGQAALKRLMETAKASGKSIGQYIKETYPNITPEEATQLTRAATKIGNLNLRQYPDEQKKQLQELFKGKEDTLKTKPMTDAQITDKANDLTSLPVTEMITRSGEGQTAAEIRRRTMTDIAKLKAISEDPNLSSQETVQRMLQLGTQQTKKVKTEIGRALGGMRTPLEAQQEQLASLRKIVDRLRSDPNLSSSESQAIVSKIRGQFPDIEKNATPAEIFKFMFRNFITSSPRTLAINATSGYGNIAARPFMRALEVTSAKVRSLLSGTPTSATYKEIGAMLQGIDAAMRKGEKLPDALKAKTFSDKYNVSPLATVAATTENKVGKAALDVTNKVISAPEAVMRKTDDHVKNILGMMEKYAAKARGEDILGDQHVIDRITSAQARGSFQDEMSSIGKWVAQSRNYFSKQEPTAFNQSMDVLTYAIQPFIQTVDRIIAKGWNTSILGGPTTAVKAATGQYRGSFAKGMMRDEVKGEKFDRDVAAAMIGIPLFVWAGTQLASGNITGSAPQDSAGREAFGNSGKTEYSVKVNGRWVQLRDLPEPMSTALQLNISLIQGLADAKGKGKDMMEGAFGVVQKVGNMLGTKQYLGGMNSLLSSMGTKGSDTVNELPLTKKILPSVVVPSAVKDVGVIKDTLQGKPRVMADTAVEALKRRAGITGGMVPELNTFGEEVTHPMMGQVKDDAAHALAEKFPPQPVERTREGVKLSQQEYYDLKKSIGEQRKFAYETLAKSDFFMKAPKGVQQTIVEQMVSNADDIGSQPQKIKELEKDPLYYDRALRTLLEIDKPGGERHFPFLK